MKCEQFGDARVGDTLEEREAGKGDAGGGADCAGLWGEGLELGRAVLAGGGGVAGGALRVGRQEKAAASRLERPRPKGAPIAATPCCL